ncbi:hypothetical protein ABH931_005295 [Streptacidiphilus sp. MAP12-33]|uniref:hypothetical protein n=1 Tax=Streptacidiphilus sp. MAP12-33 TaxID=3156266 RepID=UPI0035139A86
MSHTLAPAPTRPIRRAEAAPARSERVALDALYQAVAAHVESADPGPGAPGGWEQRERLRVSTWVRQMYDHELGPSALTAPTAEMRRDQAAELAHRLDVGLLRARPAGPSGQARAVAAVATMWEITADALAHNPRPPREQVVRDVWGLVRELLAPVREPLPRGPFRW